jgi:hypothetical protein
VAEFGPRGQVRGTTGHLPPIAEVVAEVGVQPAAAVLSDCRTLGLGSGTKCAPPHAVHHRMVIWDVTQPAGLPRRDACAV